MSSPQPLFPPIDPLRHSPLHTTGAACFPLLQDTLHGGKPSRKYTSRGLSTLNAANAAIVAADNDKSKDGSGAIADEAEGGELLDDRDRYEIVAMRKAVTGE